MFSLLMKLNPSSIDERKLSAMLSYRNFGWHYSWEWYDRTKTEPVQLTSESSVFIFIPWHTISVFSVLMSILAP